MIFSTLITLALSATALALPSTPSRRAPSLQDQRAYLKAHNSVRAQHGAAPLVWNQTLSDAGASWAKRCEFKHSGGILGPFGENLAAGTRETPEGAVKSWTDEVSAYRFAASSARCRC
jgi:pathogenesis-related protein 1